jgi:hypothetical protein
LQKAALHLCGIKTKMFMKNFILHKSVIAIVLVMLPLMSFADSFPFVKLTSKENKIITLRVGSARSDMTLIKLKDQFGEVIYSETVNNIDGIVKNFDLRHLELGQYKIELENELYIEVLPITVTLDTVVVGEDQFTTLYKPYIKLKQKGYVELNFLNLSTSDTSIMITDYNGEVVYKENLGSNSDIEKRYDMSSLQKGDYKFIVQNDGRIFEKSIAL